MLLSNFKHIHFIGIGGISMSSLAEILLSKGFNISGSDNVKSELTDNLDKIGIRVDIGQRAENITEDIELVVYTAAIAKQNPELMAAYEKGKTVIDRAELIGLMMKGYSYPISVAGTHGKTTTSSLVTEVFLRADKEPTVSIGGMLPSIGGNFKVGSDDYFILETCEYCDSFLKFNPHSAIILNVDLDHTDYFKNLDNIYKSFNNFAKRIPKEGFLVINNDIENLAKVTQGLATKIITYGKDDSANWYATDILFDDQGHASFKVNNDGKEIAEVALRIPGIHNVYNALAVFALASEYGIETRAIVEGLHQYTGTDRRFQLKGRVNEVTIIDDYAHHPTEIEATIKSARANKINDLWVAFQPHTYTRTHDLLDNFAKALSMADYIVLLDIYASREKDTGLVHSKDLQKKIQDLGKTCYYFSTFKEAEEFLLSTCKPQDMLITMGAGDVFKLGESIVMHN